jgi:hypothetical protein
MFTMYSARKVDPVEMMGNPGIERDPVRVILHRYGVSFAGSEDSDKRSIAAKVSCIDVTNGLRFFREELDRTFRRHYGRNVFNGEFEEISEEVSSITGCAREQSSAKGPSPTVHSTPENAETSSSKTSSSKTKHRRVGSRGRVSNPFILSEAEESGDEDSDSEASLRSKRHSSSDSDSDSDSESGDCFIVDNNCFD